MQIFPLIKIMHDYKNNIFKLNLSKEANAWIKEVSIETGISIEEILRCYVFLGLLRNVDDKKHSSSEEYKKYYDHTMGVIMISSGCSKEEACAVINGDLQLSDLRMKKGELN